MSNFFSPPTLSNVISGLTRNRWQQREEVFQKRLTVCMGVCVCVDVRGQLHFVALMSEQQGGEQTGNSDCTLRHSRAFSFFPRRPCLFHGLPLHRQHDQKTPHLTRQSLLVCCCKANTNPKHKSYMCDTPLISDTSVNVCEELSEIARNQKLKAAARNVKHVEITYSRVEPDFVQNTIFIQAFSTDFS